MKTSTHKVTFTTPTLRKWTKKMMTKTKRELRQLDLIFCDVKRFSHLNYLQTIPQEPHNEKERHPPQISQVNESNFQI
jgi:hypothetical protein